MPWKDKTVEGLRKEFLEASKGTKNFSSLCREFGISRKTGYKWLSRGESGQSMTDGSHAPHHIPGRTPAEIEEAILCVRYDNPEWGAKTIRKVLENNGYENLPCARTINNILQRNGCIYESESQKRKAYIRFQREHCNELWQTDFKGDFPLLDGTRCFPLDILDDHSRFCLCIEAKSKPGDILPVFESVFKTYGLPQTILSDNGWAFAGFRGGHTKFERWLMDLDILPIHGRPFHPQTQGKIERFHRTMKNELLKRNSFVDLSDADKHLKEWRTKYNEVRPHEAIEMLCPADVYIPSKRLYPDRIEPYEYNDMNRILKVNYKGYLHFDRKEFYLSEAMAGAELEMRPLGSSFFALCYRNFQIAEINVSTEELMNRRIYRLN